MINGDLLIKAKCIMNSNGDHNDNNMNNMNNINEMKSVNELEFDKKSDQENE